MNRGALQLPGSRININAHGLKRGYAQNRLCSRLAEDYGAADDFIHELDVAGRNVHFYFTSIRKFIRALTLNR